MNSLIVDLGVLERLVTAFFWPFCRIAGVFALMPVLGGAEVPVRVRVGLAVALTLLLLPTLGPAPAIDPVSGAGVLVTLQQIIVGLAMGIMVLIAFNAVLLAGESIAITMGLGFAVMNDPKNGAQVPTIGQFYLLMATLLFLALDGHHAVLAVLAVSFTLLPIGEALGNDATWQLMVWAATIFTGALGIALPALTAMLTVNLAMGVMTRAAPQLNLFSVGFPITMLVGFLAILITLPAFGEATTSLFEVAIDAMGSMLGT